MVAHAPLVIIPAAFEGGAKGLARDRTREKKSLLNGFGFMFQRGDGVEKAQCCPAVLAGIIDDVLRRLEDRSYVEEMREAGRPLVAGFTVATVEPRIEVLQIITTGEPDAKVLERLRQGGFRRHSAPDGRFCFYIGKGELAAWKKLQTHTTRVAPVDLPGASPQAEPTDVEVDEPAGSRSETAGSTSEAGAADPDRRRIARGQVLPLAGVGTDATPDPIKRPHRGEDRRGAEPLYRPYRVAEVVAPDDADWHLHRASPAQFATLVESAVAQEGPISLGNVIETVRCGLQLAAIRGNCQRKLADAAEQLVEAGRLAKSEGGFLHRVGVPILPRDRTGCDARLRTLSALPPVEIAAAVCEVLGAGDPGDDDAVVVAAALRLGYVLKTPATNKPLSESIRGGITDLIQRGHVIRDEAGRLARARAATGDADPENAGVREDLRPEDRSTEQEITEAVGHSPQVANRNVGEAQPESKAA